MGLSQNLFPCVAFPNEDVGTRETGLIFDYPRDLVECNTDIALDKPLITSYHKRLLVASSVNGVWGALSNALHDMAWLMFGFRVALFF